MTAPVTTGTIDQSIRLWAFDSDGAAVTGLTHASAGIAASAIVRANGRIVSTTALTLIARSVVGVHTDSAFTEVGSGEYVIDLPDSYFATADRNVTVTFAATAVTGSVIVESLDVKDIAGSGSGARTVTVTVNDGTTSLQNARVRLTNGAASFVGDTNASGVATFNLDDATYVVSITKSGYSYAGTTLVVDGTETVTYSMTQIVVTPPTDPTLCAVTFHARDQYGVDAVGEPVEITFVRWSEAATYTPPVVSIPPVQETDAGGLVEVELYRNATYKIVYGDAAYARRIDVNIPDASSFEVEI